MNIYRQSYDSLESAISSFISNMDIPDFTSESEDKVFTNIGILHDIHKKLSKYSLQIRELKRRISREVSSQESLKDSVVLENSELFAKLKTKDERDAAIRSLYRKQISGSEDFLELNSLLDKLLQDVNIALTECQKSFDSYELIYNFSKLNSMGYLLSQAHHKLVDYQRN